MTISPTDRNGGNLTALSRASGRPAGDILDFSANINPLGPPEWLTELITEHTGALKHYPEPYGETATRELADCPGVGSGSILLDNGASELLYAAAPTLDVSRAVIPVPSYVDYAEATDAAGLESVRIPMLAEDDFLLDLEVLSRDLRPGDFVILGQPNNPTGRLVHVEDLITCITGHPTSSSFWMSRSPSSMKPIATPKRPLFTTC